MNLLRNTANRLFLFCCFSITVLPIAFHSDASGRFQRMFMQASINDKNGGLVFRLSEGKVESEGQPQLSTPRADPLSDEAAQALLKRLPPIKSDDDDQKDFALRD